MPVFTLQINGKEYKTDVAPDTPLLWVLRDHLGMVGTKYGCGIAQCGACTVHIDGNPVRSCTLPVSAIRTAKVTTIATNKIPTRYTMDIKRAHLVPSRN